MFGKAAQLLIPRLCSVKSGRKTAATLPVEVCDIDKSLPLNKPMRKLPIRSELLSNWSFGSNVFGSPNALVLFDTTVPSERHIAAEDEVQNVKTNQN